MRLARPDPHHSPERLTIYQVDRHADSEREWAQRTQNAAADAFQAVLAGAARDPIGATARI